MKRNFYIIIFSFLIVSFLSAFQIYYSSGCAYHSGSPADGLNCGNCHAGGLITPSITLIFTPTLGFGNTYNPNTTYTISVLGSGYIKYGFDLEILNSNSSIASSVTDFGIIQTNQSDEYINTPTTGYTYSDITHSASNSTGFDFIWTAPSTGTGYLYCALLGVDNHGNTSGDKVNTKNIILSNAQTNSITESIDDLVIKTFPNPVIEKVVVNYSLLTNTKVLIQLYNSKAQQIQSLINQNQQGEQELLIDLPHHIISEIYYLKIQLGNRVITKKIVSL